MPRRGIVKNKKREKEEKRPKVLVLTTRGEPVSAEMRARVSIVHVW